MEGRILTLKNKVGEEGNKNLLRNSRGIILIECGIQVPDQKVVSEIAFVGLL